MPSCKSVTEETALGAFQVEPGGVIGVCQPTASGAFATRGPTVLWSGPSDLTPACAGLNMLYVTDPSVPAVPWLHYVRLAEGSGLLTFGCGGFGDVEGHPLWRAYEEAEALPSVRLV